MIELTLAAIMPEDNGKNVHATLYLFNKERAMLLPIKMPYYKAYKVLEATKSIEIRPNFYLTICRLIKLFNAQIECILINEYLDEIFYSCLRIKTEDGSIYDIDSKPSDSIAIALKARVPILASYDVIQKAGVTITKEMLKNFL